MIQSDNIDQLAVALCQAQIAIEASVKRNRKGNFGKYATLDSVIDAIKAPMNQAGLSYLQFYEPSESGQMAVTTILLHTSGQYIGGTATCPLPKNDPQGYGSASTYMRRYGLMAALGLAPDDDDGTAGSPYTSGGQQQRSASVQQQQQVSNGAGEKPPLKDGKCTGCFAPVGKPHGSNCSVKGLVAA